MQHAHAHLILLAGLCRVCARSRKSGESDAKGSASLLAASEAIWGTRSLTERFGEASGRGLQDMLFQTYQVPWALTWGFMLV